MAGKISEYGSGPLRCEWDILPVGSWENDLFLHPSQTWHVAYLSAEERMTKISCGLHNFMLWKLKSPRIGHINCQLSPTTSTIWPRLNISISPSSSHLLTVRSRSYGQLFTSIFIWFDLISTPNHFPMWIHLYYFNVWHK